MPRMDCTGPNGLGIRTGRGLGRCDNRDASNNRGNNFRQGCKSFNKMNDKDWLEARKAQLEVALKQIDDQLKER